MPPLPQLRLLLSAATLCAASSWPSLAQAEEEFPGALAEAADMACVPTCLMCHTVNPGTAGTWMKPLGIAIAGPLFARAGAGDVDAFKAAWASYAAVPANATNVALIKQGIEPGAMQDVCGPKYGCGASFARTTPKGSLSSALAAACFVAVASLGILRRRSHGGGKPAS